MAKITNLNNNKLTELPKSILESTNLEKLDLSSNELFSIDMGLDSLTKLNTLYIERNKITERVPELALKFGTQIDKYSLTNDSQYAKLPTLYVYPGEEFTSEDLLPEIMKQFRENNNSDAQFKGTWYITKPSGGVAKQINATVTGNDFNSNNEIFNKNGKYKIDFDVKNNSTRYWGYSTYSVEVIKIEKEKPTISVEDELTLYVDEEKALSDLVYNKDYDLKYSILDESILSFENELIKPLKAGQTTITLWVEDDYSKSKAIEVNVNVLAIPSFEIKDSLSTIDLKVGEKTNLAEYLIGNDDLIYKASSSDSAIASVEDSSLTKTLTTNQPLYIQANSVGQATITIEASNDDRNAESKTIIVNVSDSETTDATKTNNEKDLPKSGSNLYLTEIISLLLVLGSTLLIVRKSNTVI